MEIIKGLVTAVLVLAVAGIVLGASALSLSKFKATTTDSDTINVIGNSSVGLKTIAEQQPTIGVIVAMVVIIGLLAGVLGYVSFFQ